MFTRFIVPPIFLAIVVVAFYFSNNCPYCYSYTDLTTAKQSESQIAYQKIKNTFGTSNMVAVIVPAGNYQKEEKLLKTLEQHEEVKSAMGLGNIEAMDGYVLTDALNPREFSELAGVEYEIANLLYSAYAVNENQYGKIVNGIENYQVPLFDMFMFLKDQMEEDNITLDGEVQDTLDDLFDQLEKAKLQLKTDDYSRMVVYLNLPEESEETFAFLETMHQDIAKYYDLDDSYIVGNSTSDFDLSSSFGTDNIIISVLSALFVIIVLLFTFKSAGLPVLLIIVIQGSICQFFHRYNQTSQETFLLRRYTVCIVKNLSKRCYRINCTKFFLGNPILLCNFRIGKTKFIKHQSILSGYTGTCVFI